MGQERAGHALQTTALVNEAYLRLIDRAGAVAEPGPLLRRLGQLMRRILVDFARSLTISSAAARRAQVSLDEAMVVSEDQAPTWWRSMMHSQRWRPSTRGKVR